MTFNKFAFLVKAMHRLFHYNSFAFSNDSTTVVMCTGLQAASSLHSHPGSPARHSGGILEDGVGAPLQLCRHAL